MVLVIIVLGFLLAAITAIPAMIFFVIGILVQPVIMIPLAVFAMLMGVVLLAALMVFAPVIFIVACALEDVIGWLPYVVGTFIAALIPVVVYILGGLLSIADYMNSVVAMAFPITAEMGIILTTTMLVARSAALALALDIGAITIKRVVGLIVGSAGQEEEQRGRSPGNLPPVPWS